MRKAKIYYKNDFAGILKALRANGLDLVQGQKEMKVVVIRNP